MKVGKYKKAVVILTTITTIMTLINVAFSFGIRKYILYKLHNNADKADSIGIIGGADGLTSIFITGIPSSNIITTIFALLSIIGILYLISTKKMQK